MGCLRFVSRRFCSVSYELAPKYINYATLAFQAHVVGSSVPSGDTPASTATARHASISKFTLGVEGSFQLIHCPRKVKRHVHTSGSRAWPASGRLISELHRRIDESGVAEARGSRSVGSCVGLQQDRLGQRREARRCPT